MLGNKYYRAKVRVSILIQNAMTVITKFKLILIVFPLILGGAGMLLYVNSHWERISIVFSNPTLVGVGGTLLGAFIGGIFSLVGSISVSKHQIKSQAQIRRKNTIYKPLYDELVEIHHNILDENPYPTYIEFQKGRQTICPHPQFAAWARIRSDSRYLETPKDLSNTMDRLYLAVKSYQSIRPEASDSIKQILNSILSQELKSSCTIIDIGNILFDYILSEQQFNLFNELCDALTNVKDISSIDDQIKIRIQANFIDKCNKNKNVVEVRERYNEWLQAEEDAISLLAAMIKYINTRYEG